MSAEIPLTSKSAIPNPQSAIFPYPLCQPDPSKSCGACCGLYNWEDHSRATLESLLRRQTFLFSLLGEDLRHYQERYWAEPRPPNRKLMETIYNCEFLGFLDEKRKRVGCLLHPGLNGGADLRNHCPYGAELCSGHFCSSYTHLTRWEQKAVLAAVDDWYLYGLVITDIDLVKEFFKIVQSRLGDCIREERLESHPVRQALRDFWGLKENWKFASSENRLGKYYFSHSEYQIARIEYEKNWKIRPSRFDRILLSLESDFQTAGDVFEAEAVIEEKIRNFLMAYEPASF